jgi:branched-chain amino acid transport system substrate-binding protein
MGRRQKEREERPQPVDLQRRKFLGVSTTLAAGGIAAAAAAAGVGGFLGGQAIVPPPAAPQTLTLTRTETLTQTVTGKAVPDVIKLGAVGPLSPPGSPRGGAEIRDAMQLFVKQQNERGGILGSTLELVFEDTRGTPDEGVSAATRLITDVGSPMVLGEYHSSVARAIVPVADRLQRPFVTTEVCSDSITAARSPWTFRVGGMPVSYEFDLFGNFMKAAGYKNVGAVVEATDYGRDGSKVFQTIFDEAGIKYDPVEFDIAAVEYTPALLKFKEAGVDSVLIMHTNFGPITKQATEVGLTPEAGVDWMDPPGSASFPEWWEAAGEQGTNVPSISFFHPNSNSSLGGEVIEAYKAEYGRAPSFVALEAWDTILVATDAIGRAGTTDPQKLREALLRTKVLGTRIGFPPSRLIEFTTKPDPPGPKWWHQQWAFAPTFVVNFTKVGQEPDQAEILWPQDWATQVWTK